MPSQTHEVLLELFRNRPLLAPDLLRDALHVELPKFSEARIGSADLTEVQPAEYRADLVVLLLDGVPVFGIVVEVQLSPDGRKRFVWPAYVATLRARLECPVCLLVVTADEAVAQDKSLRIALAAEFAIAGLDPDRSKLYFDLVLHSLSEAARRAFQAMDLRKYEYQSDFARHYVAQGEAKGRAAVVAKLLALRFGPLTQQAESRISEASIGELDAIAERLFTAQTLNEALDS